MFRIINIFEIFSDYFKTMKEDLNLVPFLVILVGIPLVIAYFLSCLVSNDFFNEFVKNLIIINTILIPLLINVLMILYYSVERTKALPESKEKNTKIQFLRHLHLTLTMSTLVSTIILIISVLLDVTAINFKEFQAYYQFFSYNVANVWPIKMVVFFLIGFLFINILIVIKRIYLLINYEIKVE
jgi:hypothetical protein